MKLLITGSSGFVGRNLLCAMPKDWKIFAIYHNSEDFVSFLKKNSMEHIVPLQVDLRSHDEVKRILKYSSVFDGCVFLAANGDPAVSVENPIFDLESNTLTILNLVTAVTFGKFIYFSSGAVYDGLKGPVSPTSPVWPKLPYAISKLASEHYLRHFKERGRIKDLMVVRFFGAYGPHEPPRKIYSKLIKQFGIDKNPDFTIHGNGQNLIDAMYIDDTVRAIQLLLGAESINRTFDLYSGCPLTLTQLAENAAQAFNLEAKISYKGNVPEYNEFFSNDQYMSKELQFSPSTTLEEGLSKFFKCLTNTLP
ncbi:MAG: NAD-dependent epimerase/dehydratase family protein [Candidatus Omnitrophica bacterium]|nr:NAD-dependent epimerase/dehydratase family protein [Candidatus Omnitrophota bacterium]